MAARAHGQGNRGHGNPSRGARADYGFAVLINFIIYYREANDDRYESDEDSYDQMIAELRRQYEMEMGGGRDQTRPRGHSQPDMEAIRSGRHRSMGPHDMDSFDDTPHSYDDTFEYMGDQRRRGYGGMGDWSDSSSMEGYGGMSSIGMGSLYLGDHHGRGHGYMSDDDMDYHEMGYPARGFHSPSEQNPSRSIRSHRLAHGPHQSRYEEWDDVGPFSDRIYEM